MPGAVMQLASYGVADAYLTSDPEITLFRVLHKRHTAFALESIECVFSGTADFSKRCTANVPKNGDLVTRMYLQVTLPNLRDYRPDPIPSPTTSSQAIVTAAWRTSGTDAEITFALPTSPMNNYQYRVVLWPTGQAFPGLPNPSGAQGDVTAILVSAPEYISSGVTTRTVILNSTTINEVGGNGNLLKPTLAYDCAVYVVVDGVDISGPPSPTTKVLALAWTNNVAHAILDSAELEIGGSRVDKWGGDYLDVMNELSESMDRKAGYDYMVGKYDAWNLYDATKSSFGSKTYYVPLRFFFTREPSLALPIVSLQFHDTKINFEFRPYMQCIKCDHAITRLVSASGALPLTMATCKLYADFVFLEQEERRRFATIPSEMLVEQVQVVDETVVASGSISSITQKLELNFSHPVKELIWYYLPYAKFQTDPVNGNDWFKYGLDSAHAPDGDDAFDDIKLVINGSDRFSTRPGSYFRYVQPYQHHTRSPNKPLYCYSFAMFPESASQPSGSINYSKLDTSQLNFKLHPNATNGRIKVMAISWNVLRISNGLAALAYAG
jgi:hypothetical protein